MGEKADFDFKYVSKPELNKIIQKVQMAKKLQKKDNFVDPRTAEFRDGFESSVKKKVKNNQQMFKTSPYLIENSLLSHQNTIRSLLGIETVQPLKQACSHQITTTPMIYEGNIEINDAHHEKIMNILEESRAMLNNMTIEDNFKEILNMSKNDTDFLNNVYKSGFVPVSKDPPDLTDSAKDKDILSDNHVEITSERSGNNESEVEQEVNQNAEVESHLSDTSHSKQNSIGMERALEVYISDSVSSVADTDIKSVSVNHEEQDDSLSASSKDVIRYRAVSVSDNKENDCRNQLLCIEDNKSHKKIMRESEVIALRVPHDYFRKLESIQHKITLALNEIRLELSYDITKPDGIDDKHRRRKRDSEFASRFARQYLYELSRKLPNLIKMLRIPNKTSQQYHVVCNKVIHLHSIILQGLQMYLRHIPDSLVAGLQDRVKDLLKQYLAFDTVCSENYLSRDKPTMRNKIIRFLKKSRERVVQFRVRETESLHIYKSRSSALNRKAQCCSTSWSVSRESESQNSVNKLSMYNNYLNRPKTPFAKKGAKVRFDVQKNKSKTDKVGQCIPDPDIDTLMDKFKEHETEIKTIFTTKSAPELGDEEKQDISYHKSSVHPHKKSVKDNFDEITNENVEPTQSSDVLRKAIKYKKKLQKLMKSNPMIQNEDKAWDMVSKVICQLMNESIIDITANLNYYRRSKANRKEL